MFSAVFFIKIFNQSVFNKRFYGVFRAVYAAVVNHKNKKFFFWIIKSRQRSQSFCDCFLLVPAGHNNRHRRQETRSGFFVLALFTKKTVLVLKIRDEQKNLEIQGRENKKRQCAYYEIHKLIA